MLTGILFSTKRILSLPVLLLTLSLAGSAQSLNVTVTEYALASADSPSGIAIGPDGATWFIESGGLTNSSTKKIGKITTAGVVTEYSLPFLNSSPVNNPVLNGITAGPDGALWFTYTNGIGRITTGGAVTSFNIPGGFTTQGVATDITAGPDGALWFTDNGSNFSIGRITTGGTVTEYKIANPCNSGPSLRGIVAGPDGALWFINNCHGSIGRITTDGVFFEYLVPGLKNNPLNVSADIALGPDGALWFSESNLSIGRITMNGVVTEFPVGFSTEGISRGRDGAMWFTTGGLPLIGRITMAGAVTTYNIPDVATKIELGSDGSLWAIEPRSSKIIRVQVPARAGIFSHIAGGGGWDTTMTLVNTSSSAVTARLAFFGDTGATLSLPLIVTQQGISQAFSGSTLDRVIAPNTTLLVNTGALASLVTGWAEVTSTGPLGGHAIFRQTAQNGSQSEGTSPLQSQFQTTMSIPYDNAAGFVMGLALVNVSTAISNVIASIWDENGAQLATQNFTIPGNGHASFALPNFLTLTAGKRGIVQFKSAATEGMGGLGIRFSPSGSFTSVPAIFSQ